MKQPFFNEGSEKRWITIFRLTSQICVQREPGKRNSAEKGWSNHVKYRQSYSFQWNESHGRSNFLRSQNQSIYLHLRAGWILFSNQIGISQRFICLMPVFTKIHRNGLDYLGYFFYRPFDHYRPNSTGERVIFLRNEGRKERMAFDRSIKQGNRRRFQDIE